MEHRLHRSTTNKMMAGVCGGMGEYFNIDPTIVRIIWVILGLYGIGIIAYIIAALVIPEGDNYTDGESGHVYGAGVGGKTTLIIGCIMVAIGVLLLGRHYFWIDPKIVFSVIFIALGVFVIYKGWRK